MKPMYTIYLIVTADGFVRAAHHSKEDALADARRFEEVYRVDKTSKVERATQTGSKADD